MSISNIYLENTDYVETVTQARALLAHATGAGAESFAALTEETQAAYMGAIDTLLSLSISAATQQTTI